MATPTPWKGSSRWSSRVSELFSPRVTYVFSREERVPTTPEIDGALMEYAIVCDGGVHPRRLDYVARNGVRIQAIVHECPF